MCRASDILRPQKSRPYYYKTRPYRSFVFINDSDDDQSHGDYIDFEFLEPKFDEHLVTDTHLLIKLLNIREQYIDLNPTDDVVRGERGVYEQFRDECVTLIDNYGTAFGHSTIDILYELHHLYFIYALWVKRHFGASFLHSDISVKLERTAETAVMEGLLNNLTVSREVSFIDGVPVAREVFSNALDLVIAQMQDIVLQGVSGLDGRSAGHCKECGNPFVKEHGRASLCGHCRSNSVKLRNYRARQRAKREAEKNAQQTSE